MKRVNHRLLDLFRDGISLLSDLSAECDSVSTSANAVSGGHTKVLNNVQEDEIEATASIPVSKTTLSMYQKRAGTGTFSAFTSNSSNSKATATGAADVVKDKNGSNCLITGNDLGTSVVHEKRPPIKTIRVSVEPELSAVFETSNVDDDVSLLFTNDGDGNGAVVEDDDDYEDYSSLETGK